MTSEKNIPNQLIKVNKDTFLNAKTALQGSARLTLRRDVRAAGLGGQVVLQFLYLLSIELQLHFKLRNQHPEVAAVTKRDARFTLTHLPGGAQVFI